MLISPDFLNHGALGAAIMVLLIAVGVLLRVLQWAREILDLILVRFEDNTAALVRLSERLHAGEDEC